jgi:hypothetical protein
MSVSKATAKNSTTEFWRVVIACLREFHGMEVKASRRQTRAYRKKMAQLPRTTARLLYHLEPFDVACDIAGRSLKLTKSRLPHYLEIRDQPRDNGRRERRGH